MQVTDLQVFIFGLFISCIVCFAFLAATSLRYLLKDSSRK